MKLFNYIHIITGYNCLCIIVNLLLTILLICSWKYQLLIEVSSVLIMVYVFIFILMLLTQHIVRFYKLYNFLEEITTTYYFSTSILSILLALQLINSNLLIFILAIVLFAGPAFSVLENSIKKYK